MANSDSVKSNYELNVRIYRI